MKKVYKCIGFLHKNMNKKHTLLYNLATIHSIQRYNSLCELTKSCTKVLSGIISPVSESLGSKASKTGSVTLGRYLGLFSNCFLQMNKKNNSV